MALLFTEYFRTTALALSNEQCRTCIPDNDLADLLALSLDHLLEYEYGSPQLIKHIGDVLALHEKFQSDSGTVYGEIGRLWERKQSDFLLPLSIGEIRQLFPFPLMNPIVAGHDPSEMREKWEGKGLPLWKWSTDGATCWFFASSRDYAQFLESDDFVSTVLPDGAAVLCLFPPDEVLRSDGNLAVWCRKNGKLKIEQIPLDLSWLPASRAVDEESVLEPEKLASVQETTTQIESVIQYEIVVPELEEVGRLEDILNDIYGHIVTLQERFPEQLEPLRPSLKGLQLAEAQAVLVARVEEC